MKTPRKIYGQHQDYYIKNPDKLPPEYWPVGDGWQQLITDALNAIEGTSPNFYIEQIKEKFGGLRLYIGGIESDEDHDIISAAEEASYSMCEECGAAGTADNSHGWTKTLCEKDKWDRERRYLEYLADSEEKLREEGN